MLKYTGRRASSSRIGAPARFSLEVRTMPKLKALLISVLLLFVSRPDLLGHVSYNIVVDEHGTVFFIDVFNNSLMKVTRDGVVSELVDLRELETWDRPHGLARDNDGNLYVAGTYEERIWKVTPKGDVTPFWPPAGTKPLGSAARF